MLMSDAVMIGRRMSRMSLLQDNVINMSLAFQSYEMIMSTELLSDFHFMLCYYIYYINLYIFIINLLYLLY